MENVKCIKVIGDRLCAFEVHDHENDPLGLKFAQFRDGMADAELSL